MKKKLPKHLVLFRFSPNECYTTVSRDLPENVTIDIPNGTWTARGATMRIGEANIPPRWTTRSNLAIGVFDMRKLEHIKSILSAASRIADEGGRNSISME